MPAAQTQPIPDRLLRLVRADETRPVRQPAIAFSAGRWIDKAPQFTEVFQALPAALDRASVLAFSQQQPSDAAGALSVFIASQVWGYGKVGYGPHRLGVALADPALSRTLQASREHLAVHEPISAFRALCVTQKLSWVGTAFGTKYLHFADPTRRALILDSVVARWLRQHAELRFRCLRNEREYAAWLALSERWAGEAESTPERIELLVFSDGLSASSQWLPD